MDNVQITGERQGQMCGACCVLLASNVFPYMDIIIENERGRRCLQGEGVHYHLIEPHEMTDLCPHIWCYSSYQMHSDSFSS